MHLWHDLSLFTSVCGMAVFEGQVSHLPALQQQEEVSFRLCWFLCITACLRSCLFPRAAVTKHLRSGGSDQQRHIESQFWRPEVQNQGVGRAASSETDGGGPFLISQLLAAQESLGWWLNHFPLYLVFHVVSSLCVPSLLLPRTSFILDVELPYPWVTLS